MNLSKTKIGAFFLALLIMGWFLYPRELFLGYIYEGAASLKKSERNYQDYLAKNPWSKFATLRLVSVYERMGNPDKALDLLKKLIDHRKKDWALAHIYLDHLENGDNEAALYQARLAIARNFMGVPHFPREKIETLLYDAYEYARWKQKTPEMVALLGELAKVSRKPKQYYEELESLDLGFKNTDKIIKTLKQKLLGRPQNPDNRNELAGMYASMGQIEKAVSLINEGLTLTPHQIDLLKTKYYLEERNGNLNDALITLETLLSLPRVSQDDRTDFLKEKAYLLLQTGKEKESVGIYQNLLFKNKRDPEHWTDLIGAFLKLKRTDQAIRLIRDYLTLFPEDDEQQKNLVELYLYEKKDITQFGLYQTYVKKYGAINLAIDVGFLLLEQKALDAAVGWGNEIERLFPQSLKVSDFLMEALIQKKKYAEALEIGLKVLKREPQNAQVNLKVAGVYSLMFNNKMAARYYEKLASLKPHDRDTLVLVGKELFFAGEFKKSLDILNKVHFKTICTETDAGGSTKGGPPPRARMSTVGDAVETGPARHQTCLGGFEMDPEALFWMSEDHWALGRKKQAKREALEVRRKIGNQKPSQALMRMDLKSRGRILFNRKTMNAYEQAQKKYPSDMALQSDFLELLLDNKKFSKAIPLLENNLKKNPSDRGARLLLSELHDKYDSRVGNAYHFLDLGSDEAHEGGVLFRSYLSDSFELKAEFWEGHYHSPENSFSGEASRGEISGTAYFRQGSLSLGTGAGHSDQRTTVSPLIKITFEPHDRLSLTAKYQYHLLRVDIPQAVAKGDLEDRALVTWNTLFAKRFHFSGEYEFDRNLLPDGAFSYENRVEPMLTYTLFKKPELLLGYQYSLSRVFDHQGFLSQVPLLPRVSSHYFVGQAGHHFTDQFYGEAGFFIGEDTSRHLHFFEGDLWGLRGLIKWNWLPWLDLDGSYEYGRESLTGVAGQSHNMSLGLSGHW